MTTYELLGVLDEYSKILNGSLTVMGVIASLAGSWYELTNPILEYLGSENVHSSLNSASGKLTETINYIKGQAPSRFAPELVALQNSVQKLQDSLSPEDRAPLQRLSQHIASFIRAYDTAIQVQTRGAAIALLSSAASLNNFLDVSRQIAAYGRARLSGEVALRKGFDSLILFLDCDNEANSVAERIAGLSEVYERVCLLLEVHTSEYPLTIQHGEFGSLFLKVVGNGEVIKLLSALLSRALQFVYRYSAQGKLDSLPRRADDVERILKLRDELAARGLKSEQLDRTLMEATVTIAGGMTKLLQRTMKVRIDGEVREVPGKFRTELEHKEPRLLGAPGEGDSSLDSDRRPKDER